MCGGTPQSTTYTYKDGKGDPKLYTIKKKDLETINRWTKGAFARRKLLKTVAVAKIASKFQRYANYACRPEVSYF